MRHVSAEELQAWVEVDEKARAAFRLMTPDEKKTELARRRAINAAKHAEDNLDLSPLTDR